MDRPRDNQRQRVYDAEGHIPDMTHRSAAARRILDGAKPVRSTGNVPIAAVQEYVDHLTGSAWFRRRWGHRVIKVNHKVYGKATATLGMDQIQMPPWSRTEDVILHEVAHCLNHAYDYAPHGPEFVGILLTLVRHRMGAEAAAEFRKGIRKYRVRVSMAAVPAPSEGRRKMADVRAEQRKRALAARSR